MQSSEAVKHVLRRQGLVDRVAADGSLLLCPPHRSCALIVRFQQLGGVAVARLAARVLERLELTEAQRYDLLGLLNEMNATIAFGKLTLDGDEGLVSLEYDLVIEDPQPAAVLAPVEYLLQVADELDDRLLDDLGSGRRAADVLAWMREHAEVD